MSTESNPHIALNTVPPVQIPQAMDSLPGMASTDLTLAATFIPADLLQSIADLITRIDLSLFGMNGQFDPDSASIFRSDFADIFQPSTPIHSTAAVADSFVFYNAEFA